MKKILLVFLSLGFFSLKALASPIFAAVNITSFTQSPSATQVKGNVVNLSASINSGAGRLEFYACPYATCADDQWVHLGGCDTNNCTPVPWDTVSYSVGSHSLAVNLYDSNGFVQQQRSSYNLTAPTLFEQYKQQYEAINNRFGLGGGCTATNELGATWVSNWGHGSQYANQGEEGCQQANGSKFFYTVGDQQNDDYSDPNNPYGIAILEHQYLLDDEDRTLYQSLKTLIGQMAVYNGDWNKKDNTLSSFLLIPKYVKNNPGAVYIVGTEPERTIGSTVEAAALYAKNYNIFYRRVKKYDPMAKVAVGKLTSIQNGNFEWINRFRERYKALYGSYPITDIWAVNPYVWSFNPQDFKNSIINFDTYLNSIGESNKPLWLTEMGIALWDSLNPAEEQNRKAAEDYMSPVFEWVKGEGTTKYHIEKIFWSEYFPNDWSNPTTVWIGSIVKNSQGEFNPQGIIFQKSTRQPILANKGFESSILKPYGWWFWDGATGKSDYNMTMDTNEKHGGRTSVKIHVGSDSGPYGNTAAILQTIQSTDYAGKYVRESAWCKTANNGTAGLKINITHADGTRNAYWSPSVVPPSECSAWKQIATPWVLIPDDVISLEVDGDAVGQNATVWFDDFNLETRSSPPTVDISSLRSLLQNFTSIFDYNLVVGNFGSP